VTIGATPVNQLNALPLVTANAIGNPGEVLILGGTLTKYWSPSALGINGQLGNVLDPDDNTLVRILSLAYIDAGGCNTYTLLTVAGVPNAGAEPPGDWEVYVILNATGGGAFGSVAPRTGTVGKTRWARVGTVALQTVDPAAAYPYEKGCSCNWSDQAMVNLNVTQRAGLVGRSAKIWLSRAAAGATAATYYASMWGQS